MAKVHEHITNEFKTWIETQHVFFVASAPLDGSGHVNVSPKGMDCLRVLDDQTVAYLDMTGSGNETSAHLTEDGNGRVTFMWCAFEGAPRILRLYGKGRVVLPSSPEWNDLIAHFDMLPGARQIIVNDVERVQTSCGFAVPFMEFQSDREALKKYAETKGEDGLVAYRQEKNMTSIDGLPTAFACD